MAKHRRGPWSQTEDNHLIHLVHNQGAHNWVRVSQLIQSRSPKQCRERYHQNLKPSLNLDPISPEEGVLIERMVAEMGKRWAEIARRLHGRSDNAVKNWWNGGMNRRRRLDNRRAELPARQAQTYYQHLEPPTQHAVLAAAAPPPPPLPPPHRQDFSAGPPCPIVQRLQPLPQFPQPLSQHINTAHVMPSAHRRIVESSIPSPSAVSCVSRTDSDHGAPPSLVSDMSYASHSYSPHCSPQSNDLLQPTRIQDDNRCRSRAIMHLDHGGQPLPPADTEYQSQHKPQVQSSLPYYTTYSAITNQRCRMPPRRTPPHAVHSGQLPLPSFSTITALDRQRTLPPPSPPRDERMNLSTLMH